MSAILVQHILKDVLMALSAEGTERVTTEELQKLCIAESLDLFGPDDSVLFEGTDGLVRIENALSRISDKVRKTERDGEWLVSKSNSRA